MESVTSQVPRREPHIGQASVVPVDPALAQLEVSGLLHLAGPAPERLPQHRVPRRRDHEADPHAFLRELHRFVMRRHGEAALLGEVGLAHDAQLEYFGTKGTELAAFIAVHNFGEDACGIELSLPNTPEDSELVDLLHDESVMKPEDGRTRLELEGYAYRWFRLTERGAAGV